MNRNVAQLSALAVNAEVFDGAAIVQIAYRDRTELGPAHCVIEQNG